MRNELSKPVIFGVIGVVVIALAGLGFVMLRDKAPTKVVNKGTLNKLPPAPQKVQVPDWVRKKLAGAPSSPAPP
jgi:hypothetical protein